MSAVSRRRTDGSVRALRVGRDLQRRLAQALAEGVGDPPALLALTRVRMSADLSHARVYYVLEGGEEGGAAALDPEVAKRLVHALRRRLAHGWALRRLPAIDLVLDEDWRKEERMLALLRGPGGAIGGDG